MSDDDGGGMSMSDLGMVRLLYNMMQRETKSFGRVKQRDGIFGAAKFLQHEIFRCRSKCWNKRRNKQTHNVSNITYFTEKTISITIMYAFFIIKGHCMKVRWVQAESNQTPVHKIHM